MEVILRQNIFNQMFFEELQLIDTFRIMSQSRYLFLHVMPIFSLLIVGNQGAYDLHFFKVTRGRDGDVSLDRVYVFKLSQSNDLRILGVSVQDTRVHVLG